MPAPAAEVGVGGCSAQTQPARQPHGIVESGWPTGGPAYGRILGRRRAGYRGIIGPRSHPGPGNDRTRQSFP